MLLVGVELYGQGEMLIGVDVSGVIYMCSDVQNSLRRGGVYIWWRVWDEWVGLGE